MPQLSLHGPMGSLTLSEEDGALVSLDWGWAGDQQQTPVLCRAREQLHAYFDQALSRFDLPLAPAGSRFQQSVWAALSAIPYGETRSHAELAADLAMDPRAVGRARALNPLPILIPSHRLVGSGRRLGAFGPEGDASTKRFLIDLERKH